MRSDSRRFDIQAQQSGHSRLRKSDFGGKRAALVQGDGVGRVPGLDGAESGDCLGGDGRGAGQTSFLLSSRLEQTQLSYSKKMLPVR